VPEHRRRVAGGVGAGRREQVGVANAARDEADEDLARLRLGEVDFLYLERLAELLQHRGTDLHAGGPTSFSNGPAAQKGVVDDEQQPPYGAYAAIMAAFCGGLLGAGLLARALGRDPEEHTTLDLVTLALATYKAARTLSRDEVTSFLREPFVEGRAHEGGEDPVEDGGMRQALGELVTCSRCVGTWVAAGLGATQIVAPRFGRLLTWSLGAAGLNDFLQAGFAALTNKSNEIEERVS
jgi:hypothetical protein